MINYDRFVGVVFSSAKDNMTRGKDYEQRCEDDSERLHKQFLDHGDREIADEPQHSLDAVGLPILDHNPPPRLSREHALVRECQKIE